MVSRAVLRMSFRHCPVPFQSNASLTDASIHRNPFQSAAIHCKTCICPRRSDWAMSRRHPQHSMRHGCLKEALQIAFCRIMMRPASFQGEFHETCHSVTFYFMKEDSRQCCDTTTPESIHTKDESKRGSAFAFIFGVN